MFLDDDTAIDQEGPESEPGSHAVGYQLLNVTALPRAGDYHAKLATIILPQPYRPGDEVQPMAMFKSPLEIAVRRVE